MRRSLVFSSILLLTAPSASGAPRPSRRPPGPEVAKSQEAWRKRLVPPAIQPQRLPSEWKIVPQPKGFQPRGGGGAQGSYGLDLSESVDRLVRESAIVVVGIGAGNDGSFYHPQGDGRLSTPQYTTYYLRVIGYLKDATGRRAPFLKILAPGGFLNGGQGGGDGIPFPYIEEGHRYLLYLTPNEGVPWGGKPVLRSGVPLFGRGDEYWTTGMRHGRWFEDGSGKLQGQVFTREHWPGLGLNLPLGPAIQRVQQAVARERRGVPLPPRPVEEPQVTDPGG
ncbi:MAG TPA: hypothetical protein VK689_12215 [Armatimonadota bacterium]|nr:hypothetical protein [Armatimonadota bacterium]